jgi:hypothetical protein
MTRSYQELCVGLRYGVIVKRKATMRYAAHVTHHSTKPNDGDEFTVVPIEASDELAAARRIAEIAARRRFQDEGAVAYVHRRSDNVFLATIGVFKLSASNGVTHGCAISIRLRDVI